MSEPFEPIRLATLEECESIAKFSDLTPTSWVFAFDNKRTGNPDIAVVRRCVEIDPMIYTASTSPARKAAFVWGLQNILRAQGDKEYYFQINPADLEWKAICEKWGAFAVTPQPELRMKKLLQEPPDGHQNNPNQH